MPYKRRGEISQIKIFNPGVYILPNKGHNGWGKKIGDFKKGEEKSG